MEATLFALTLAAALAAMGALWLLSLALRDASIVDVYWGPGFLLLSAFALAVAPGPAGTRALLVTLLAGLWGLRLCGYLLWRNRGAGEDYRYRAMRRRHGERFPWVSLATVFGLQGLLQWVVSLPLQVAIFAPPTPLGWSAALGLALYTVGLVFEGVGDLQLARFKADPAHAGRVMDSGLWRYTRHPNYFGDFLVWWGFYAIAWGAPGGPWTALGPLVMSVLLLRVSGVALLERSLARRKPDYEAYRQRTSAFFPWLPGRRGGRPRSA